MGRKRRKWFNICCGIGKAMIAKFQKKLIPFFLRYKYGKPYNLKKKYKKIPMDFSFPVNKNPLVSIVITTYNKYEYTISCLWSILQNTNGINYEILIGDNRSEDETKNITKHIKGINFIVHDENEGYLRNANKAVPYARGKYILLMNNDVVVLKNWLQPLLDMMQNDEKIGLCAGKSLYPNHLVFDVGWKVLPNAITVPLGRKKSPLNPDINNSLEVDYLSCYSLFKKDTWDKIGGYDEQFAPCFYEDVDLCFKIRYNLGLKIMYQPKSEVYHLHKDPSNMEYILKVIAANKEKFYKKWKKVLAQREDK